MTRLQLLFPPFVSVATRSISGAVLMYEYLHCLRRTGSREEALRHVVAVRWHAMQVRRYFLKLVLLTLATTTTTLLVFPG